MEICELLEELEGKLNEKPALLEGRGISIERGAGGAFLSASAESAPAAARAQALQFPFKTVVSGEASVTVLGYNAEEKRFFRNYVTLGQTRLELAETELETASDSWVYLEVSYDEGYAAELKAAGSLPEQSSDRYIVPIAFVKTSDGKASSVQQLQLGYVEGSGRIF